MRCQLLVLTILAACAHAPPSASAQDPADASAQIGRTLVEALSRGAFEVAGAPFTDQVRQGLSPQVLSAIWAKLQAQLGPFEAIERVDPPDNSHRGAFVRTRFRRGALIVKVFVDANDRISGLFFAPATEPSKWTPPPYAAASTLERPLFVGTAPPLPGHLSLPQGSGPFPLAILVPGTGPNDEDETVGDNKPFKDLALGLAARGVAVLRYDKRTHHPQGLPKLLTIQDEYFGSVADALELARRTPEIDPQRIALVGHSLGGMLVPWLAREHPEVAGIAILAGPHAPGLDGAIRQFDQLLKIHPNTPELAEMRAQLIHDRDRIASPDLRPEEPLLHSAGAYRLSLRGYDPVATAAALDLPIFVAQGTRDYNVFADTDYPSWQAGLAHATRVTFKLYPDLNHLFIPWGGTDSVEDNKHPGHVSQPLVEDLAAWLLARFPRGAEEALPYRLRP